MNDQQIREWILKSLIKHQHELETKKLLLQNLPNYNFDEHEKKAYLDSQKFIAEGNKILLEWE